MTRQQLAASSIIAVAAGMAVVVWAAGRGTGAVPAAGVAAVVSIAITAL